MRKKLVQFLILAFTGLAFSSFSQSNPRYLILFKDKSNSPFSVGKPSEFLSDRAIQRRTKQKIGVTENDLPVNPAYINAVKETGALAIFPTKWFNGLVVEATDVQLEAIKKLLFYKGTELNLPIANLTSKSTGVERAAAVSRKFDITDDVDYGAMRDQLALLGVENLHAKGFHGENMLIAVFDNGFLNTDKIDFFKPLFDEKRIIDTYDFHGRTSNVYHTGSHGQFVFSIIAANKPGQLVGPAFKAAFALYRTENDFIETPYEEVAWLMAAERADSVGVDIINSSLGYSNFDGEFDRPEYNYTYEQMDGKTTIIARAARFAGRKGILVVNAAGNRGADSWRYIMSPADVDSVLTVGGSDYERNYYSTSSIGPNALGQQKPDVAAVGSGAIFGNGAGGISSGSGTSYASPQIAGLAAILWQAHGNLSAQQIISALKKAGHQASSPDNLLGFGVPDSQRAEESIAKDNPVLGTEAPELQAIFLAPNPVMKNATVSFPSNLFGRNATLDVILPNGQILSSTTKKLTNQAIIESENFPAGLYLLRIRVKDQVRTLKFVKQ